MWRVGSLSGLLTVRLLLKCKRTRLICLVSFMGYADSVLVRAEPYSVDVKIYKVVTKDTRYTSVSRECIHQRAHLRSVCLQYTSVTYASI